MASPPSISQEKSINKQIDDDLKKEKLKMKEHPVSKLILLGPGDSGKTTLLKQMKILHGNGFSDDERRDNLKKIRQNIIDNMQALIKGAETLGLALSEPREVYSVKLSQMRNQLI